MSLRVLVAEANDILRKKYVDVIDEHIKLQVFEKVSTITKLRDAVKTQDFNVVLIGNSIAGGTPIDAMEEVLKIKDIPILYAPLLKDKMQEFPNILNLGFIETVQILTELDESNIADLNMPKMVNIKCTILAKLNMKRFRFQYESFLKDEFKAVFVNRKENKKGSDVQPDLNKKRVRRKIASRSGTISSRDVIVIGASTGGPKTLVDVISQFPPTFPPVLVVQHMPRGFIQSFAKRLDNKCKMKVQMANNGDQIKKGNVYVAQGGYHMEVYVDGDKRPYIQISDGPTVNFVKPSVDVTLFSAVRVWGKGVISVILTGMGADGKAGTRVVKKMGGRSIAQSAVDSVIYGMNKAIVEAGLADKVLMINEIPIELAGMLGYTISEN